MLTILALGWLPGIQIVLLFCVLVVVLSVVVRRTMVEAQWERTRQLQNEM